MVYSRRVLLYSGNRSSGTTQSYTIALPFTLNNVQRIEWRSASISGYMMTLQDFNESQSSGGKSYWRFLDAYSNQRWRDGEKDEREYRRNPQSVNSFVIAFFNPDGSTATISNEHAIELEVFCDE